MEGRYPLFPDTGEHYFVDCTSINSFGGSKSLVQRYEVADSAIEHNAMQD